VTECQIETEGIELLVAVPKDMRAVIREVLEIAWGIFRTWRANFPIDRGPVHHRGIEFVR
jgi:hypothetical protein